MRPPGNYRFSASGEINVTGSNKNLPDEGPEEMISVMSSRHSLVAPGWLCLGFWVPNGFSTLF